MRIYSIVILIILLSIASQPIFSQSVIQFGIKAGVSSTHIEFEFPQNRQFYGTTILYDMRIVNPTVSIFIRNRSLKSFHYIAEFQFIRMGGLNVNTLPVTTVQYPDGNGTYVDFRSEVSIQSINFAIGVEPTIEIANLEVFTRITPTLTYLLSVNNFFPFSDNYNRTLLGYQIGGGILVPWISETSINFEVLYGRHLKPFYTNSKLGDYHTKGWLATIGIAF
jgi:hypothetical protein